MTGPPPGQGPGGQVDNTDTTLQQLRGREECLYLSLSLKHTPWCQTASMRLPREIGDPLTSEDAQTLEWEITQVSLKV